MCVFVSACARAPVRVRSTRVHRRVCVRVRVFVRQRAASLQDGQGAMLYIATERGRVETVKALIAAGLDTKGGKTRWGQVRPPSSARAR